MNRQFYMALPMVAAFLTIAPSGLAQTATITTYAGLRPPVSGVAATAQFIDRPTSVAADGAGGFYFMSNYRIYHVTTGGVLDVVAGTGTEEIGTPIAAERERPALSAELGDSAMDLVKDKLGNLLFVQSDRVRKVSPAGMIVTALGGPSENVRRAGNVILREIRDNYDSLSGVAVDADGNLFALDAASGRILKLTTAGDLSDAMTGLGHWRHLALDASGNFFVTDENFVYKLPPDGPLANLTPVQSGIQQASGIAGLALDTAGNLFVADSGHHRILKIRSDGSITVAAGAGQPGFSGDGGPATSAQLSKPRSIAVDAIGNLFIADTENRRIRKVTVDGRISTAAGTDIPNVGSGAPANSVPIHPTGMAVDAAGNVFIGEGARILKVDAAGMMTTLAGNGVRGWSGDGGSALAASLSRAENLALDGAGNLFFVDSDNARIRKITPAGIVTTIAGNGSGSTRGPVLPPGSPGRNPIDLRLPCGLAVDPVGNVYIREPDRILKVTAAGAVTTVAQASPTGLGLCPLAVDRESNLFFTDAGNVIRKLSTDGTITTIAGNGRGGQRGANGDGGPANRARFEGVFGLTVDTTGNLFIADSGNRVREVDANGIITTVAGDGTRGYSGDGGPAVSAQVARPVAVALDAKGNLYIAENIAAMGSGPPGLIRKVTFAK